MLLSLLKVKLPINFFNKDLQSSDDELYQSIALEFNRQTQHIELIAYIVFVLAPNIPPSNSNALNSH